MKLRMKTAIFVFLILQIPIAGLGQIFEIPYYGKNKVVYNQFSWKIYPTEHFKIYYYTDNVKVLKNVAEIAESGYQKISQLLKHQLSQPVPLLYYSTYTDFEQTNMFEISEGILGVSEPVLHRIGIHGDMPLEDLQTLIDHELTHVFEFDILWGNPAGSLNFLGQPPLWAFEGLSEYATGTWSPWSRLIVRDAVLNDRIPDFSDSGELVSRYPLPREPAYDFGHAAYEFIVSKFGAVGLREFWTSLKNSSKIGRRDIFKRGFNLKAKNFTFEFKKYLRLKNEEFFLRENPENYSVTLGPEFPVNPYYFAFSHALSPSGDIVAALTFNIKDMDIDLVLLSTKDGSVIRNITPGYTTRYENIKFEVDPSQGKNLAWSADGDTIAFFARDGQKHSLFLADALSGKIRRKIKLLIDQPASPSFLPSGTEVLCAGFEKGIHDIFKVDLADGSVTNLTQDDAYQKAPEVSPDGKSVVYSISFDGCDQIFLSPLENLKKRTCLTSGKGNCIAPHFSPDSKEIFFSGDWRGAYNIYSMNLETGLIHRYTDVRTGNFYPEPLPGDQKTIVFSSFNKGAIQIFKSALDPKEEQSISPQDFSSDESIPKFKPALTFDISQTKIQSFRGIGKLYLMSDPQVQTVMSTDGSLYGGSTITFSDLLGDHNIVFSAYQVSSLRSYFIAFINQKRRFQYMASAFQYSLFYYPDYNYFDPDFFIRNYTYADAIASRNISGVSLAGSYPLSRYYRGEIELSYYKYEEYFLDIYAFSRSAAAASNYFWNGSLLEASASFIGETTFFKRYGPVSGNTFRFSISKSIPLSKKFFDNANLEMDVRQYLNIGSDFLLALRINAFMSFGKSPFLNYFGGNNQIRSAYYNSIIANRGWYANTEFRFPLISTADTIIGTIGPLRGVLFLDVGRAKIKGFPAKIWRFENTSDRTGLKGYDAIGSYGYGLEFFLFGFPMHLEFVKAFNIADISNPFKLSGAKNFVTNFWIGFDF